MGVRSLSFACSRLLDEVYGQDCCGGEERAYRVYEPCIVMNLQGKKTKINHVSYDCTELEDGDKINVRMAGAVKREEEVRERKGKVVRLTKRGKAGLP